MMGPIDTLISFFEKRKRIQHAHKKANTKNKQLYESKLFGHFCGRQYY
jgi:hypothetical protein